MICCENRPIVEQPSRQDVGGVSGNKTGEVSDRCVLTFASIFRQSPAVFAATKQVFYTKT